MMSGTKCGYVIFPKSRGRSVDSSDCQNFMKCLMRMYAEEDKGVVFYETVLKLKWQKHTFIECVPLPWEHFEQLPGYFKVRVARPLRRLVN